MTPGRQKIIPDKVQGGCCMMISVENLFHRYPAKRKQAAQQALDGISLSLEKGDFFVLTGPNGGGKSTLFRILCGLMQPSAGRVLVKGIDLFADPSAARRSMGVVFQHPALDKYLSILENLRIHADLYGLTRAQFDQRLEESLTWTALEGRLEDDVGQGAAAQAGNIADG